MSIVETQTEARPKRGRAVPVAKAVGRFLVAAVTTYLGLLAVTFFIGRVVPIDPVLAILGDRAPAHVVERVRRELGLDLPLYQQFYHLSEEHRCRGDFGTSVLTTNPVMTDIRARLSRRRSSSPRSARSSARRSAFRSACWPPSSAAASSTRSSASSA